MGKRLVMVIEDEDEVRELIVRILETKYQVVAVENGLEALKLLDKGERPDMIITDIMMPYLDGIEFTSALRKFSEYQSIPIVFLTAKSDPEDIIKGIQSGATHYITKPFSPKKLLEKVDYLFEKKEKRILFNK